MIETYKIISGQYESEITPTLAMSDTGTRIMRGNDLRLHKSRFKYDMRKFYFANRVVDHWNRLPNWVVTANNIKLSKKDLSSIDNIILFTISERKFKELEVVVKFYEYYSIFYSTIRV